MSIDILLILLTLGVCTGFLAGLLGIGGGMLMVPVLTLLLDAKGLPPGLSVKVAIATSMACIAFTSLASVRAHHRRGAVRWELVRQLSPGLVLGGWLAGGTLFAALKGAWLTALFALFVGLSALQMWRGSAQTHGQRPPPGRAVLGLCGALIGALSGLVGAGGGFLTVPLLSAWAVPIHQAVATSAAAGFPIAVANTLGYLWSGWGLSSELGGLFGFLYLPALLVLAPCTVALAPWGARAAHALPVATLKRLFALLLLALASYMAWRAAAL